MGLGIRRFSPNACSHPRPLGLSVARGHADADGLSLQRADRADYPCLGSALIAWRGRAGAMLCPSPSQLELLADPRLMLPPQVSGRLSCKRLRPLEAMERHEYLTVAPEIWKNLATMSAAKIDRALRDVKDCSRAPRRRGRPGSELRRSIPIKIVLKRRPA